MREDRITQREAGELMAQQCNIANSGKRARDDGRVTVRERLEWQIKQNKAKHRIVSEANDDQHRQDAGTDSALRKAVQPT